MYVINYSHMAVTDGVTIRLYYPEIKSVQFIRR